MAQSIVEAINVRIPIADAITRALPGAAYLPEFHILICGGRMYRPREWRRMAATRGASLRGIQLRIREWPDDGRTPLVAIIHMGARGVVKDERRAYCLPHPTRLWPVVSEWSGDRVAYAKFNRLYKTTFLQHLRRLQGACRRRLGFDRAAIACSWLQRLLPGEIVGRIRAEAIKESSCFRSGTRVHVSS